MEPVDNSTFLTRLAELFSDRKGKGTIWLTHKRYSYDGVQDNLTASAENGIENQEYPCLIRATDGKNINFSTQVNPEKLGTFHAAYGALLKASMTTLRKRDKKREKLRAEQQAMRKRKLAEPVVIEGPKRGNGRRKRQRLMKAALRQEESRRKAAEREELKSKGRDG